MKFFPNVIDSWNLLDVDTQNQHSRLMFKTQIRSNISVPPPFFPCVQENTTYSIVQKPNSNTVFLSYLILFLSHLSDGSGCPCGDVLVKWFRVSLGGWSWRQLSLLLCLSTFHLPKNFAVYSTERFSRLPKHWCTLKGITWPFFWW